MYVHECTRSYPDGCPGEVEQPSDDGEVLHVACLKVAVDLGDAADYDKAGADSLMYVCVCVCLYVYVCVDI